jgi:hypothetical protein
MACEFLFHCKIDPTMINFGLCEGCMESLEGAAVLNQGNFGIYDEAHCLECGLWYHFSDYLNHSCVKNAGT